MPQFNFNAPADLFPGRSRMRTRAIGFRRFGTAAEAIRFAIEQMPSELLLGSILEADVLRVNGSGIRELYDSAEYPLKRKAMKPAAPKAAEPKTLERKAS